MATVTTPIEACGFCLMRFFERQCQKGGVWGEKILTLPPPWKEPDSCVPCGLDVFRVPSRMSKQKLVAMKDEQREAFWIAWLDEVPDHCTCDGKE